MRYRHGYAGTLASRSVGAIRWADDGRDISDETWRGRMPALLYHQSICDPSEPVDALEVGEGPNDQANEEEHGGETRDESF